ncbi:hypothetical protein DR864_28325 (plasmid) [Runella rosea]|uniref:Uncharacterized protein n=1 Tax=Runella rosea TaxID=2259595 RepID=A0A344TT12_9BACT|nr:hypothetical protein DR864_28325 [Runella rosea]
MVSESVVPAQTELPVMPLVLCTKEGEPKSVKFKETPLAPDVPEPEPAAEIVRLQEIGEAPVKLMLRVARR